MRVMFIMLMMLTVGGPAAAAVQTLFGPQHVGGSSTFGEPFILLYAFEGPGTPGPGVDVLTSSSLGAEFGTTIYLDSFVPGPRRFLAKQVDVKLQGASLEVIGTTASGKEVKARIADSYTDWTTVKLDELSGVNFASIRFFATPLGTDRAVALIDNLNLDIVPVPAAGLLLLSALGGLAALRRVRPPARGRTPG